MEDTVTYTSKLPASTWLIARCAFSYDHQLWTDTIFFLRKQWILCRNLMLFRGIRNILWAVLLLYELETPESLTEEKFWGWSGWPLCDPVFVQSCSYFVTLDLYIYMQHCKSVVQKYRTQVFSESVFCEHKIIFNVLYEYFMW
jgi:hypothetical protein